MGLPVQLCYALTWVYSYLSCVQFYNVNVMEVFKNIPVVLLSKVLEVSSPTAGSALLGPSQIQSLQAAQELTVRTMSAHGESCDSFPVNVPSKLPAIMAGPAFTSPVVPALTCPPAGPTNLPSPLSYGNSAAKVSMLPSSMPSDTHIIGLTVEVDANTPHALHSEEFLSSASYVKAWANPSSAAALAVCEATLPVVSTITPVVSLTLQSFCIYRKTPQLFVFLNQRFSNCEVGVSRGRVEGGGQKVR